MSVRQHIIHFYINTSSTGTSVSSNLPSSSSSCACLYDIPHMSWYILIIVSGRSNFMTQSKIFVLFFSISISSSIIACLLLFFRKVNHRALFNQTHPLNMFIYLKNFPVKHYPTYITGRNIHY